MNINEDFILACENFDKYEIELMLSAYTIKENTFLDIIEIIEEQGNRDLMKMIIDSKQFDLSIGSNKLLLCAVDLGFIEIVGDLLKNKKILKCKSDIIEAIELSIENNNLFMFTTLLNVKMDINDIQNTILLKCCEQENSNFLRLLVNRNFISCIIINLNLHKNSNQAINLAYRIKNFDSVNILLRNRNVQKTLSPVLMSEYTNYKNYQN
jgi:uncharacterized protein YunC (DUF1805 family)